MSDKRNPEVVNIKKYPNRRYYDPSRSCHLTLQDVYDLVVSGKDVCVTDSRTSEDITNLVLTQILLEKDQPKLDVFPTSLFHTMIRSNRQVLRGYTERFLGPFLGMLATSQRQVDSFLRQAMGGGFSTPFDWASGMMKAFSPHGKTAVPTASDGSDEEPEPVDEVSTPPGSGRDELADLRTQLADLTQRIEHISSRAQPGDRGAGSASS